MKRLGCNRRRWCREACSNGGTLSVAKLGEAVAAALEGYFSDAKLAERRLLRFMAATNAETDRLRNEATQAERVKQDCLTCIERIKHIILTGGAGPTTTEMLRRKEATLAEAEREIAAGEARRSMILARIPPQEVIASLHRQGFYERRQALRALIERIDIQSVREGNRWTEKWIGTITPVPTAGLTHIPDIIVARTGFSLSYTNPKERRIVPCRTPGSFATAPWSSLP